MPITLLLAPPDFQTLLRPCKLLLENNSRTRPTTTYPAWQLWQDLATGGLFFEFSALVSHLRHWAENESWAPTLKKVSEWITEDHGILGHRLHRIVIDSLLWHSNAVGNLGRNSRRTSVNSTVKHLILYMLFLFWKIVKGTFQKKDQFKD